MKVQGKTIVVTGGGNGIEKNKYYILIGSDAKMMDFLSRLMPEHAAKIIYSQMRSILPD